MMLAAMVVQGRSTEAEAAILEEEIPLALARCVALVGGHAAEEAPVYTNALRLSLDQTGVDRVGEHEWVGWIGVVPYWWETEYGTGPQNVPVGDGTPGSGLLHWVKSKKLAVVKLRTGADKGMVLRRSAGVDQRSGAEGKLGSVGLYRQGDMQTPVRKSRRREYVDALSAAELSMAIGVHNAILEHGLRAQEWFRRSEPQRPIDAFADEVSALIGGRVWR